MDFSLIDLLQSTGPIRIFELLSRTGFSDRPNEVIDKLEELRRAGTIRIDGPKSGELSQMNPAEIASSYVELTRAAYRKSFTS